MFFVCFCAVFVVVVVIRSIKFRLKSLFDSVIIFMERFIVYYIAQWSMKLLKSLILFMLFGTCAFFAVVVVVVGVTRSIKFRLESCI